MRILPRIPPKFMRGHNTTILSEGTHPEAPRDLNTYVRALAWDRESKESSVQVVRLVEWAQQVQSVGES